MIDINFEIISSEYTNNLVIFKIKCYEFEPPFFTYTFNINVFNKLTEEEIEYQIYRHIYKQIIQKQISTDNMFIKMDKVKDSINVYNDNMKNKKLKD